MKATILRNEDPDSSLKWEFSCQKANIEYNVIDLTASDWYDNIASRKSDIYLLKPPGETFRFKQLYDERLYVISEVLKGFTFPTYKEVLIYENKRMLSAFLQTAQIPMPETWIFYNKERALSFAKSLELPIVGKTAIGASGTGVSIIRTKREIVRYINTAFGKGIKRRLGPNRNTGSISKWVKKAYNSPEYFYRKVRQYWNIYNDAQVGFVILQEYVPHDYEWRIVKIGDSWFGHQKVKIGDKASGTKGIDYVTPPVELFNFCLHICNDNNFHTMALDIFEHPTKGYVINELQTIFGHVQDYIMMSNGKIGRYRFINGSWLFEEGDFNSNESFDLRLKTAIDLYSSFSKST